LSVLCCAHTVCRHKKARKTEALQAMCSQMGY
jgi:hypothetical protein